MREEKTFETVGELVEFLLTKDKSLGVCDTYGQYLVVSWNPYDSGEDLQFVPGDEVPLA